jgi:hypothetical protein
MGIKILKSDQPRTGKNIYNISTSKQGLIGKIQSVTCRVHQGEQLILICKLKEFLHTLLPKV